MPPAVSPDAELGLNLALAVVSSSHAPVLLLDENRAVIVASDAFCTAFDIDLKTIVSSAFADLGDGALSVSDDGIGMTQQPGPATAGLGTNIVQALAKQMDASVTVTDAAPGTRVTLEHHVTAAQSEDAAPTPAPAV